MGRGIIGGVGDGFVPGVRLAGEFYAEAVRPLLEAEFPGLGYAAALIGRGVGGARVRHRAVHRSRLGAAAAGVPGGRGRGTARRGGRRDARAQRLPDAFGGYPVAFGVTARPGQRRAAPGGGLRPGRLAEPGGSGSTRAAASRCGTGWPRRGSGWRRSPRAPCSTTGPGGLTRARAALSWYPRRRVAVRAELPVEQDRGGGGVRRPVRRGGRRARLGGGHGPAGARPDAAVAAHAPPLPAVQQVAGHAPSPGSPAAPGSAATWPRRWRRPAGRPGSGNSCLAYRIAAEAHNRLGLTEPLDPGTRPYYDRPYQVLDAGRFAAALSGAITGPAGRGGCGRPEPRTRSSTARPALGDLRYARAVTSVSGI